MGDSSEDPGHSGKIVPLGFLGRVLVSSQKTWKMLAGGKEVWASLLGTTSCTKKYLKLAVKKKKSKGMKDINDKSAKTQTICLHTLLGFCFGASTQLRHACLPFLSSYCLQDLFLFCCQCLYHQINMRPVWLHSLLTQHALGYTNENLFLRLYQILMHSHDVECAPLHCNQQSNQVCTLWDKQWHINISGAVPASSHGLMEQLTILGFCGLFLCLYFV